MADGVGGRTHEAADRLSSLAERLAAHLDSDAMCDKRAWAALTVDGERQPWTAQAQREWERGGGPDRHHHLAIACHSRAYDLERQGDTDGAHPLWRAALGHWREVWADADFWVRMRERLSPAFGEETARETVDLARQALPRDLLQPHLALALRYKDEDPRLAAQHMLVARTSGMPDAVVEEVVRSFAARTTDGVMADIQEAAELSAVDTIAEALAVDAGSPYLVRLLLTAFLSLMRRAEATETDWVDQYLLLTKRVVDLLKPYLAETGLDRPGTGPPAGTDPQIVTDLAALAFWQGLQWAVTANKEAETTADDRTQLRSLERSIEHFERSLELDPDLDANPLYEAVREMLLDQHLGAAVLSQNLGRGDQTVRRHLAPVLRGLSTNQSAVKNPELVCVVVVKMAAPQRVEVDQAHTIALNTLQRTDLDYDVRAGMTTILHELSDMRRTRFYNF